MVLKGIGVMSCGKALGACYAIFGVFLGTIVSLVSLLGVAAFPQEGQGAVSFLFGAGAVLLLPIFYGFVGLISGIVMAVVYNVVAGLVGGIELDLEQPIAR